MSTVLDWFAIVMWSLLAYPALRASSEAQPATNFHSGTLIFHPFLCLFFILFADLFISNSSVCVLDERVNAARNQPQSLCKLIIVLEVKWNWIHCSLDSRNIFLNTFLHRHFIKLKFKLNQLAQRGITIIWLDFENLKNDTECIFNRDAK